MELVCMQCKKTLKTADDDELSKVLFGGDGVYLFCSKGCQQKWVYNPPTGPDSVSERKLAV
jgi:hypothetical protein